MDSTNFQTFSYGYARLTPADDTLMDTLAHL